jgi:hypothetical protein
MRKNMIRATIRSADKVVGTKNALILLVTGGIGSALT